MENQKKINNKGFSIVEIIIVVSILAVLTGVASMSISVLTTRPVDDCTQRLKTVLEGNRITTMGKLSSYLEIYKDGEGYIYIREYIDGEAKEKRIGENSVNVQFFVQGDQWYDLPDEANKLVIKFNRSSGSLKPQAGGTYDGKYIEKFAISRGERRMEVAIDRLTGRVNVVYE